MTRPAAEVAGGVAVEPVAWPGYDTKPTYFREWIEGGIATHARIGDYVKRDLLKVVLSGFDTFAQMDERHATPTPRPVGLSEEDEALLMSAIPTSWLDPMLTGENRVIGDQPFTGRDIEEVLKACSVNLRAALRRLTNQEPQS